ncbi:hypothetical protein ATE84_1240 [Aquimarina sp. MAR_2010_214]|uniref:TraQ conjugal transfer family protein n=1 Tax=Aquimarina sp. MAR_2010_214 TaxID=1250026 RepID=UPI000C70B125|nr:TraQ conjugal transfer family protein [Aquimarina sp. MAR_2010_214]PKV49220.1 hypothetical protein ATE84_1240 [Aquimarina sp. MAR_2010_214]
MKKIIILVSIALSIISCEELDVDIQNLEKTNFTLTTNTDQETLLINQSIELNLSITIEEPVTEELNFSMKYFDTGVEGKLSINGVEYAQGEIINNISNGIMSLNYLGTSIGAGNLTFQVTASNEITKEIIVPITVNETDFEFTVLFDKEKNYINESTPFSIDIKTKGTENLTYKVYFKNVEGEVKLDSEDQEILQNREFNLSEGITFGEYEGTKAQDTDIEFIAEASNGVVKSKVINFETLLTDFEVVMTPDPLSVPYRWDLSFTYFIKRPDNLKQEIEYYLHITSVGLGDLMYIIDGSEDHIPQGFEWNIGNRISNGGLLKQLGMVSPRKGVVTFHFRDSNGATYEKSINVDYYDY